MEPVIVIGNGIAGISCARHLRKQSDVPICIISEEDPYFFSRTALMYVYMGHMPWKDLYPYEPH
ncbi:MAG: NAD(P)/FAD-dependent oxidoreductase, partial [Flavobacteriaceae bacterium]